MKNTLPELNDDVVIELAREGGIAWIPALSGPRRFALANVSTAERERIGNIIRHAMPQAREPGETDGPGRGDQFYYRIHIRYSHSRQHQYTEMVLLIPENHAPPELTELWRTGVRP